MRLRRPAAATLGLVALLPALAACGEDSAVKIGDVVDARYDDQFVVDGKASAIVLPIGRLEISAGKPTTTLSAEETAQLEVVEAPDGSAFVPITWQYDSGTFGDYAEYVASDASAVVDLVADRASYRIPAPKPSGEGADSFYVLVAGNGEDASLSVEYDGVTQTLELATGERDEGEAAALYDLRAAKARNRSCDDRVTFKTTRFERVRDFSCRISRPVRLPYAGGAWADPDQTWAAVTLTTTLRRLDRTAKDFLSGALYITTSASSTFTLGGEEPARVIEDRARTLCPDLTQGGCTTVHHLVFAVDKAGKGRKGGDIGRLRVAQGYELTRGTVWGAGEPPATVKIKGILSIPLR